MSKVISSLILASSLLVCGNAFADECVSAYGRTVCGFNCVRGYGDVKCSRTPFGACIAAYGELKCWDPARRTHLNAMCIAGYGKLACGYGCTQGSGDVKCSPNPGAQCVAAYGTIECGYRCVSAYVDVKCSDHPGGQCAAAYGSITCS